MLHKANRNIKKWMKRAAGVLAVTLMVSSFTSGLAVQNTAAKATKDSVKTQVQKQISGTKQGAYTYYLNGINLMRVKKGKKAQKIATHVQNFRFISDKIYYTSSNNSRLYCAKKDGSKKKLIAKHCRGIIDVMDDRIIYGGALGMFSVKLDGKANTKIASYTNMLDGYAHFDGRVYYSKHVTDEHGSIIGANMKSNKLDGTDQKKELDELFQHNIVYQKMGGQLYAFVETQDHKRKMLRLNNDVWEEVTELTNDWFCFEYVKDSYFYGVKMIPVEGMEAVKPESVISRMDATGKIEPFIDFGSQNVTLGDSLRLEKQGKYWVVWSWVDDSYPVVYICNESGTIVKTITVPRGDWGDSAGVFVKVSKNTAYVMFTGGDTNLRKYKTYKLK